MTTTPTFTIMDIYGRTIARNLLSGAARRAAHDTADAQCEVVYLCRDGADSFGEPIEPRKD